VGSCQPQPGTKQKARRVAGLGNWVLRPRCRSGGCLLVLLGLVGFVAGFALGLCVWGQFYVIDPDLKIATQFVQRLVGLKVGMALDCLQRGQEPDQCLDVLDGYCVGECKVCVR